MKKHYLALLTTACSLIGVTAQAQTDLSIGNISAGFEYNAQTGIIKDIYFTILSNENNGASNFKVGIYFVPPGATTFDQALLLESAEVSSISGNASRDVTNWTINVNEVENVPPDGNYRLLVYVDNEKDISETDENNNGLFLSSQGDDLTFTKGTSSGFDEQSMMLKQFTLFPNPSNNMINLTVATQYTSTLTCNVVDMTGKTAMTQQLTASVAGTTSQIDINALPAGIYTIQLINENGTATRRFIKQ